MSDNRWKPIRDGFDFLYYIDNNIGGSQGRSLSDMNNKEGGRRESLVERHTQEESDAEEERYDTAGDVNFDDDKGKTNEEEETEANGRKHDEF